MFCRFCGNEIPEGGKFCAACGKPVDCEEPKKPAGQDAQTYQQPIQSNIQQPYGGYQTQFSQPQSFQPQGAPVVYPMKWFKFIIYVQLFISIAVLLSNTVRCTTGLLYGEDAYLVYMVCPGLKVVNIIYGVVCLVFAVAAIVIRQRLAHYKAKAPALYIGYFVSNTVIGLLYTFATFAVLSGVSPDAVQEGIIESAPQITGQIIAFIAFVPLNYIYFKKREKLFVN